MTGKSLKSPKNLDKAGVGGTSNVNSGAGQYKIINVAGTRSVKTISMVTILNFILKKMKNLSTTVK